MFVSAGLAEALLPRNGTKRKKNPDFSAFGNKNVLAAKEKKELHPCKAFT